MRDKACALSPTRGHSNSYTCQTLSQNDKKITRLVIVMWV